MEIIFLNLLYVHEQEQFFLKMNMFNWILFSGTDNSSKGYALY